MAQHVHTIDRRLHLLRHLARRRKEKTTQTQQKKNTRKSKTRKETWRVKKDIKIVDVNSGGQLCYFWNSDEIGGLEVEKKGAITYQI